MAKLSVDYNLLKVSINGINDSISTLNRVINVFNGMRIPYDYSKRQTILNLKDSLEKRRDELEDIKEWIINSCKDYDNLINDFSDSIRSLSIANMNPRKGL